MNDETEQELMDTDGWSGTGFSFAYPDEDDMWSRRSFEDALRAQGFEVDIILLRGMFVHGQCSRDGLTRTVRLCNLQFPCAWA